MNLVCLTGPSLNLELVGWRHFTLARKNVLLIIANFRADNGLKTQII